MGKFYQNIQKKSTNVYIADNLLKSKQITFSVYKIYFDIEQDKRS